MVSLYVMYILQLILLILNYDNLLENTQQDKQRLDNPLKELHSFRYYALEMTLETLQMQKEADEKLYDTVTANIEALQKEIKARGNWIALREEVKRELERKQQEISTLKYQKTVLTTQIEQSSYELTTTSHEVIKTKDSALLDSLNEKCKSLLTEKERLEREHQSTSNQIDQLLLSAEVLRREKASNREEIKTLVREERSLTRAKFNLSREIQELCTKVTELDSLRSQFNSTNQETFSSIKTQEYSKLSEQCLSEKLLEEPTQVLMTIKRERNESKNEADEMEVNYRRQYKKIRVLENTLSQKTLSL